MRFVTTPFVSVAILFTLVSCAPGQAPKPPAVLPGLTEAPSAVVLSHDGKTLVSVSCGRDRDGGLKRWGDFRVWDVEIGKVLVSFQGHDQDVQALALSPDGATLASADWDGGFILWSMADQKIRRSHKVGGSSTTVAFSADSKRVGAVSESAILICDTTTGAARTSSSYRGRMGRLVFSPDLTLVATPCHQDVDLLDAATAKLRRTLPDHHGTASGLAFSADGKTLAVNVNKDDGSGYFSEIVLWDVATGAERACVKDVGYCYQLALSADGKRLVLLSETTFRSESYELRVIEASTGRSAPPVSFKGKKKMPYCLSFSGDGKTFAVGCSDGTLLVYDMP